jgi:uncharacterized surface protein with fasciclin (FAS1) repeats
MYDFSDFRSESKNKCEYPPETLMGIINSHSDFTIFSQILKKAKYDIKLSSQQSDFTIFVPSDSELKKKYTPDFFNDIDVGLARQIVNASVLNRKIDQNLFQSSPVSTFPLLNRSSLYVHTVSNITILKDHIKVIHWNHPANNGLIHVVDDILFPDLIY